MKPGEHSLSPWKPIPHRGANHSECTGLPFGSAVKRDKAYPPYHWPEESATFWCLEWDSKDLTVRPEQPPADTSRQKLTL